MNKARCCLAWWQKLRCSTELASTKFFELPNSNPQIFTMIDNYILLAATTASDFVRKLCPATGGYTNVYSSISSIRRWVLRLDKINFCLDIFFWNSRPLFLLNIRWSYKDNLGPPIHFHHRCWFVNLLGVLLFSYICQPQITTLKWLAPVCIAELICAL